MRLLKQLIGVFAVLAVLGGVLMLFSYDIIKIQWVSFMGIQPSHGPMNNPLPVPAESIPVEGPAYTSAMGVEQNPVPADDVSIARGAELFAINCKMCHGEKGDGNGQLVKFLANHPADLTQPIVQTKNDRAIFYVITSGVNGRMPALNENLTVRDRWDVVNFVRTLAAP
jgi:mono/diheme cytochrome c family protein